MNPDELLLRDIHLPAPVSAWPPAPGWWLLAASLIGLAVFTVWWRRRRLRIRNAPSTLARGELERLRIGWREHGDPQRLIGEVSTWLRRAAMALSTRQRAARLTGNKWRAFLDELAGEAVFDDAAGRLITEAPYRGGDDSVGPSDGERLLACCERWLGAVSRKAGQP